MRKALLLIFLIVVVAIVVVMVRSTTPVVDFANPVTSLGQATPISVHVHDAHGIKRASATVEQNGAQYQVWEMSQASKAPDSTWKVTAGS